MKGASVNMDWRTIQLFLSDDGVHEVEIVVDDYRKMRCTCSYYKTGKRCKHIRHIRAQIDKNGGDYSIKIPEYLSDDELHEALLSPESFRELLIHHSHIEVLP